MPDGTERLLNGVSRSEGRTVGSAWPLQGSRPRFDAFLSYCRAPDEDLARALQDGLHQFARPWNRVRALRIFRDKASLSASDTLRGSLDDALANSNFLILLASVSCSRSHWVAHEVDWWCNNRELAHFLIVLTDGEIVWDSDRGDFDWERTTALPPILRGRFAEEPLHVELRWAQHGGRLSLRDPRFQDAVADLGAPLHGRPKDELIGEDIRQHRRLVRFRRTVFGAIGALLAGVGVATYVAEEQRIAAAQQHVVALAGRLWAAQAGDAVSAELAAALLVESLRRMPTADASSAAAKLLRELPTARVQHDDAVNSVAFSPDGTLLASASDDNSARVIDMAGVVVRRTKGTAPLLTVALSPDSTLLATGSKDGQTRLIRIATGEDAVPPTSDAQQVTAVAFNPVNGALLASAAWDGTVRLRSTATGRDVVPPLRTAPKACCVVFSADGTRLATGNAAGTRLIDTATGQDVVPPMALGAPVTTLAFSPDGTMLAIGSADRTARLVSTATGSTIGAPVPHGDAVRRVAFSPDGHWWATASNDRRARLLDARTGGQVAVITHGKAVRSVDFSADSALLATGSLDGTARLIEIRTGQEVARIMHGGGVMKVAFNPQVGTHGQLLATASYRPESLVRLVDTANGITFRRLPSAKPVQSISISGDSRLMAIAGADNGACDGTAAASVGYVSVVRLSDGTVFPPVLTEAPPCRAILSSDGRLLVMSLADGAVEAMDLTPQATALGTSLLIRIRHRGPGAAVALSPDGAWVASGGEDGAVQVVDVRTGTDVVPPVRLPGAPTVLQFSDDKEWLGIACEGGTVLLAQLAGPGRTRPFSGLGQINSLVFSPDSHLLATASSDATARIIDVAGGRELEPPIKGIGNVASVAFSPDGRLLATSEDGAARLFDVATRKEVRRLKQGGQPANNVTFSPDGRFVATVNDDDTARLFAVGSGDEVSRFAQDRPITTVAYTPDGQLLAVGDSQEVTLYWADPQLVIDRLCRRQGRNMTDDEWEHYIGNGEPRRPTCAEWRTDASPALTR